MGVTRRSVPPSCPVLAEGWRFGEGQALRRLLKGGTIKMTPQPDRTYIAEGEYFPLLAITEAQAHKTTTPRPWGAGAWHTDGCAGAMYTLYHGAWRDFEVVLRRAA